MPDEIDLLRQFRADTPGPDDAAWERARTTLALASRPDATQPAVSLPAVSLPAVTPPAVTPPAVTPPAVTPPAVTPPAVTPPAVTPPAVTPPAGAPPAGAPHADRRRWRRPGRRVAIATAVIVAAAAGVLIVTLQGRTLSQPVTTAWQPARPLPSRGHQVRAPAGAWRLMSYLLARGWQENTAGPAPGLLSCPTATSCYVEGDSATSPSGPADMNSLYISTDGTQTWSVLPVPTHVTFTSPLACATADARAAGALYYGHQPIYLSTTTGGHSWTARPLPAGIGVISELACVAATHCRGLAAPPGVDPSSGVGPSPQTSLVTTLDGGRHWATRAFPAGDAIQSVSCPTEAECVAAGVAGRYQETLIVLVSRDAGATWRRAVLDRPQTDSGNPDVTCVDASHCWMLGYIIGPGNTAQSQYSVFDSSSDGGATWTSATFPRSIPYPRLEALACPTVQTCYAAGGDLIPQRVGGGLNEQSSVVAVTHDGGRTWQRVSFAVPAKVPAGMQADSFMDIGQIECPQPDACVAIGVSDQGSTSTPVYSNHG